jgi:hypothetical protein
MSYDYLEIIEEYCSYRNSIKRFRVLYLKYLQKRNLKVYDVIKILHEDFSEKDDKIAVNIIRDNIFNNMKKIDDLGYLKKLVDEFISLGTKLRRSIFLKNEIKELSCYIFMLYKIYFEIIETLRHFIIINENRNELKHIMGKLVKDTFFNYGFLEHDYKTGKVFQYIFWVLFYENKEHDNKELIYNRDVEIFDVQKKLCNDEQSNENAIKKRKQKKGKNEK